MAVILRHIGLAYVPVPKNACTTVKEMLHICVHGVPHGRRVDPGGRVRWVHNKWPATPMTPAFLEATQGLIRFAILRHPVDRLVSCWRNRVVMYHELSAARVGAEALAARDLPADPDFATFVARLGDYRAVSPSIAWHTMPQTYFLGRDPAAFTALFRIEELAEAHRRIEAWTGRSLPFPHEQSSARVAAPAVPPGLAEAILASSGEDWSFIRGFY